MIPAELSRGLFPLAEILTCIRNRQVLAYNPDEGYSLYAAADVELAFDGKTAVYVSDPSVVTDTGEEIYPDDVQERGFWMFCQRELVEDVVDNAIHQKPAAATEELVEALRFYMETTPSSIWNSAGTIEPETKTERAARRPPFSL